MYVILTSKDGLFRTEIIDGLRPLASYDYLFYGTKKATFVSTSVRTTRALGS